MAHLKITNEGSTPFGTVLELDGNPVPDCMAVSLHIDANSPAPITATITILVTGLEVTTQAEVEVDHINPLQEQMTDDGD